MTTVGLISDTHGLMRPEALEALAGSDLIVHAGDIGSREVVDALERIAPVYAVRGNTDRGAWADVFPATQLIEIDGLFLYVVHDVSELDIDPAAAQCRIVVYGHSHRPLIASRHGVLFINPGSAGLRRSHLPAAVARLRIGSGEPEAQIVQLRVG